MSELKQIGTCALCGAIIYASDSGAIMINGSLFCAVSCAEEATGQEIKTGKLTVVSEDELGDKTHNYTCLYCGKVNTQDDGSSVTMENNQVIVACGYCGKEAICIDEAE